ncbi:MAG: TMEM165/GDT1 family protein [archaeon]|nr:TMEM165/GDT1 family protein [archaeon]
MSTKTPVIEPYVEPEYHLGFLSSILQSFILTLVAELGDRTFILLIILTYKTTHGTVLSAAIVAELGMNILAMLFGLAVDILLYKNLIDYLGIMIFTIFGVWLILNNISASQTFDSDLQYIKEHEKPIGQPKPYKAISKQLTLIQEDLNDEEGAEELLSGQEQKEGEEQRLKTDSNKERNDTENNEVTPMVESTPIEHKLSREEEEKMETRGTWFKAIVSSMALAECGDRTQFTSMSMAAIFDFKGVLIGSGAALVLTCFLGVYCGSYVTKILREKVLNIILGLVFLTYAGEIFYSKYYGMPLF